MDRYVVFRNVRSSSTEKLLNYLRKRICINVRMVNDQHVGKKSETNSAQFFKPRFLRLSGFKIMDSFG